MQVLQHAWMLPSTWALAPDRRVAPHVREGMHAALRSRDKLQCAPPGCVFFCQNVHVYASKHARGPAQPRQAPVRAQPACFACGKAVPVYALGQNVHWYAARHARGPPQPRLAPVHAPGLCVTNRLGLRAVR